MIHPLEDSRSLPARSLPGRGRISGDSWQDLLRDFEDQWQCGHPPPVEQYWDELRGGPISLLANLVKIELTGRFERGERPTAAEYLERFPELRAADERVLSLAYEEYCLLEERGEAPGAESFCNRYEPWADSLASQLQYHRMLSRLVTPTSRTWFPETGDWFADEFHLRAPLGDGGAGRVFLAYHTRFQRQVALKITPDTGSDREPEIVGRLDHERIVPVWSVAREAEHGLRGLCMPYRPGLTLMELLRRIRETPAPDRTARTLLAAVLPSEDREPGRELPVGWRGFPVDGTYAEAAAWVAMAVARALEHAHARCVVHRDVKPANILLTVREGPQLLDFNLADAPSDAEQAQAARSGGTLPYMAPEQLHAFLDPARWPEVGPPADLYSLGLVLHELLDGDRPDAPDSRLPLPRAVGAMLDLRALPMPPIRARNPDVPHALEAIVARCLAFEPDDRYHDAAALAEDLQRFLERRPLVHARNPSLRERAANWSARHRLPLGLGGGFGLLAGGLLVLVLTGLLPYWILKTFVPNPTATLVGVANDKLSNGQLAEADSGYRKALRLDEHLWSAWYGLASVSARTSRDHRATIQLLDRAMLEAEHADLTPEKWLQIEQTRYVVGLKFVNILLGSHQYEMAAQECLALLAITESPRSLRRTPELTLPRLIANHARAKAFETLAILFIRRGDLQTCRLLQRQTYNLLALCLTLRPDDPTTLQAIRDFLPSALLYLPDDRVLGELLALGIKYPELTPPDQQL